MMWMMRMRKKRRRNKGRGLIRRRRMMKRTEMRAVAVMRRATSERLIGTPGEYAIVNAGSWVERKDWIVKR